MLPKTRKEMVQVGIGRETSSTSTQMYAFWMNPFLHQLRKYFINGRFLNQKT